MLFVIGIVFMIASLVASFRLKSKLKAISKIPLASGLSGKEVAELMLADHQIRDVKVISVQGELTDHYNPMNKTVNLSPAVYNGRDAGAIAVAAHECGHAVQHAKAYAWLEFRSNMVPVQSISANILNVIIMISIFGGAALGGAVMGPVLLIIIGCNLVLTLFSLVTLPVEYDASNRALAWITNRGVVTQGEHKLAKEALNLAASTYLIAALGAVTQLLYFVLMFLGVNRED